ncbi:MAG: chymotrypsin family serine protease [Planctomycetota bacterium]|jgi:hypothetical protein
MFQFRQRIGFCLAVVAISLIVLGAQQTAPTAAAAQPQANAQAIARVTQIQDRNTNRLMAIKGVVGTATGLNPAGQPVVKVFLAKAGVPGIPAKLEGVPVAVEVTGEFFALPKPPKPPGKDKGEKVDPTSRFERPVPIGVSTGHPNITAGTIGCRVTDGTDLYALSNNHVCADCNQATIGDPVLQPGDFDGGVALDDTIGWLFDFQPIDFSGGDNTIDAAIAISSADLLGNATPSNGYGTPKSTTMAATIGLKVKKYGRTTGQTSGRVEAVNATFDINYGGGKIARFVGQIVISPGDFSAGGDSGSLVVADGKGRNKANDRKPVALLFAGNFFYTIGNPIDPVLDRFGVTVDGE